MNGKNPVPIVGLEKLLQDYKEKSLFFAIKAHQEVPDNDIIQAITWINDILAIFDFDLEETKP